MGKIRKHSPFPRTPQTHLGRNVPELFRLQPPEMLGDSRSSGSLPCDQVAQQAHPEASLDNTNLLSMLSHMPRMSHLQGMTRDIKSTVETVVSELKLEIRALTMRLKEAKNTGRCHDTALMALCQTAAAHNPAFDGDE